jgi:Flp pilus assembly protein TadG
MRVSVRVHREESGVAAVLVILLLMVLVAMTALAIDGGLMWAKFRRVRSANDAAALAAAISCAKGEGLTAANTQSDALATANVADVSRVSDPVYDPGCEVEGGKVTVAYGGEQTLMFAPAVGISSPKPVTARATATWGGAGASADVVPLTLMRNSLSTCNFVPGPGVVLPAIGTLCGFWWDNGALGDATWGYMNLASWPTDPAQDVPTLGGCSSAGGVGAMQDAIVYGLDDPLELVPPPPTYVCAENGAYSEPIDDSIQEALLAGRTDFAFPVSDPALTVYTPCNQPGCSPTPYKYAIIGFAFLQPVGIFRPNEDGYAPCLTLPFEHKANARCLVAKYVGFSTEGLIPGGGGNFGLVAVGLSE